ncbi:MAG: hypothetical protein K0S29_1415 [Gammaproteobacteria bacterium]|jgi:hypothetical protein|nr:hypothetical protein [Gammaproteobacteria bacterium]
MPIQVKSIEEFKQLLEICKQGDRTHSILIDAADLMASEIAFMVYFVLNRKLFLNFEIINNDFTGLELSSFFKVRMPEYFPMIEVKQSNQHKHCYVFGIDIFIDDPVFSELSDMDEPVGTKRKAGEAKGQSAAKLPRKENEENQLTALSFNKSLTNPSAASSASEIIEKESGVELQ